MGFILDKIILIVLSFFTLIKYFQGGGIVVCLFGIIITTSLIEYLNEKENLVTGIEICLAVFCLIFPACFVTLPVLIYDVTRKKNIYAAIISGFAFIHGIIECGDITNGIYVLVLCSLAVLLAFKTVKNVFLEDSNRNIRDDSVEQENLLREQNIKIINNQDREVYVAKLKERNRIARDIHDNVGHMLSRSILQMGALLAIHKEEPLNSQLNDVRKTLDTAMNNIRESVHDLHDESIDLNQAVNDMINPIRDRFKVRVEYDVANQIPKDIKYAIIGIIKECISNIIKHSKNEIVDITINEHPSMYQVVVHDYSENMGKNLSGIKSYGTNKDGELDLDNLEQSVSGIGLINIKNRVKGLKGTLNISNQNGFRVFAMIPKGDN